MMLGTEDPKLFLYTKVLLKLQTFFLFARDSSPPTSETPFCLVKYHLPTSETPFSYS